MITLILVLTDMITLILVQDGYDYSDIGSGRI